MDMKLDQHIIKSSRAAKAWSQEHLAHVAGLGVRTIQRAESSGLTSYESALAIASALEMSVTELIVSKPKAVVLPAMRIRLGILVTFVAGLLFLETNRAVLADQVVLDVNATVDQKSVSEARRTLGEDETAEFQIGSQYQLVVSPTILESGEVRLSMQLSKYDGEQFVQIARPQIVTPNQQSATLRSEWNGTSIGIEITPTIE